MNKGIDKKKYKKALDFAYKLHLKQIRKGTQIPYFFHLSSVSNFVIENDGTVRIVIKDNIPKSFFILNNLSHLIYNLIIISL